MARQRNREADQAGIDAMLEDKLSNVDVTDPGEQQVDVVTPTVDAAPFDPQAVLQGMVDWAVDRAERTDTDDDMRAAQEVARILAGESAEAVLSESAPLQGKNMLVRAGRTDKQRLSHPFLCHGFTVTLSDFEDGFPAYATLDASTPDGEMRKMINVGGLAVLAALRKLDELGEWPVPLIIAGYETKKGFTTLKLLHPSAVAGLF